MKVKLSDDQWAVRFWYGGVAIVRGEESAGRVEAMGWSWLLSVGLGFAVGVFLISLVGAA